MRKSQRKRLYILVIRREKNVVPVADEAGWRQARESAAFADEMGLIEVAEFVDDVGPGPVRGVATGEQRSVEPDRPCEQFWRHAHLCRKPTLKLARAEAGLSNEALDLRPAPRGYQQTRCVANRPVGLAFIQNHPCPTFDGGYALTEVRCRAYSVAEGDGRFAENIRGCGVLIDQRRHIDSDQTVQAGRLKQNVENMNRA